MKKNGFVFMETLIVVCILTLTLTMLFTSYSYILTKTRTVDNNDTINTVYKEYSVIEYLKNLYSGNIDDYFNDSKKCESISINNYNFYKCSDSGIPNPIKNIFGVDKIYKVNTDKLLSSSNSNDLLIKNFDATTIDYINRLGKIDQDLIIIKYKIDKGDGEYEVYHSSDLELNSNEE